MASAGTQGFTPKRRKRTIDKYAHIADIPVDIFLEVATFLSPQDLLQLSRVSHHFRKILLHPSSEMARRNMKNPPPPPKGLSESKYASLLFEHRCFGCGTVRAGRKDYNMSVRFCARCWKNNVSTRSALSKKLKGKITDVELFFSLLNTNDTKLAGSRYVRHYYYVDEFNKVLGIFWSLSGSKLDKYVKKRQWFVKAMQAHARAVIKWELTKKDQPFEEEEEVYWARVDSIEEKLLDMGWPETSLLPPESSQYRKWKKLVYKPEELTDEVWCKIRPQLEDMMKEHRYSPSFRGFDGDLEDQTPRAAFI